MNKNMISKQRHVIITVTILVMLSGILGSCTPGNNGGNVEEFNPYQGNKGVTQQFLENSPPKEIDFTMSEQVDTIPFTVSLLLENEGAHDVQNGVVVLGFEEDYVVVNDVDYFKSFTLLGKSKISKYGEENIIKFSMLAKNLEPQSQSHTVTIISTLCYDYKTAYTATACIDLERYINPKTRETPICTMRTMSSGGQGAPIAVTKVETELRASQEEDIIIPDFKIYIANRGNGQAIAKDSVNKACSSETLEKEDLNTVYVNAWLGETQLNCRPKNDRIQGNEGYVKFGNRDEDYVKCTLEEGNDVSKKTYQSPLRITLDYGYTHSISKDILIRKEMI